MLKPIDLTALVYLVSADLGPSWTQVQLAAGLGVSQSSVNRSLRQLAESGLLVGQKPHRGALRSLLLHGVPYVYPATIGAPARGLPTAHAGPFFAEKLHSAQAYVWPFDAGTAHGPSLQPLHPCVPAAALRCAPFYGLMAIVDVMRVGRARERKLASSRLDQILEAST